MNQDMKLCFLCTEDEQKLRAKTSKVETFDKELQETIENMFTTMINGKGIGLAAPQVGISKRFFVIIADDNIRRVFINPEIVGTSVELCSYEEGCLSIPGVWADVDRPERVKIQAWNEKGRPFVLEAEGLLARVIQHEYDHLDGIVFTDRLSPMQREKILKLYQKKLKM